MAHLEQVDVERLEVDHVGLRVCRHRPGPEGLVQIAEHLFVVEYRRAEVAGVHDRLVLVRAFDLFGRKKSFLIIFGKFRLFWDIIGFL